MKTSSDITAASETPLPLPARMHTCIPKLDVILKGGFLSGCLYLLFGPPGAGKTIFANQMSFGHLQKEPEGRVVYVTGQTENHGKLMLHMGQMDFFHPAFLEEQLVFFSLQPQLRAGDMPGVIKYFWELIRHHQPSLLVIDGADAIERMSLENSGYSDFFHQLSSITALSNCTALLLFSQRYMDKNSHPGHASADGVIELDYRFVNSRMIRELTVHKHRGSDCLQGRHEFDLSDSGMCVYPRLELLESLCQKSKCPMPKTRLSSGVNVLDSQMGGGVWCGSSTAILGESGAGKSLFGMNFLWEGSLQGEYCFYFACGELPSFLSHKAEKSGRSLQDFLSTNRIFPIFLSPAQQSLDAIGELVLSQVSLISKGKRSRIFIDDFELFYGAAGAEGRVHLFLHALVKLLGIQNTTLLIAQETGVIQRPPGETPPDLVHACDNVLFLRYAERDDELKRSFLVLKMKESEHEKKILYYRIESENQWLMEEPEHDLHPVGG